MKAITQVKADVTRKNGREEALPESLLWRVPPPLSTVYVT